MSFGGFQPRIYKKQGKKFPSATSVLSLENKPALIQWAANCTSDYVLQILDSFNNEMILPSEIRGQVFQARYNYKSVGKEATDIGTEAHDAIEHYFKEGELPDLKTVEAMSAVLSFLEWWESVDAEVLSMEKKIFGDGYAGRYDMVANIDGKITLIDFKTSKAVYPNMGYQLAGYRKAYNDSLKKKQAPIEEHAILRLPKEGQNFEYADFTEKYEQDLEIFMTYVRLFHLLYGDSLKEQ